MAGRQFNLVLDDFKPTSSDNVTLHGDTQQLEEQDRQLLPILLPPYSLNGDVNEHDNNSNIVARWEHVISDSSELEFASLLLKLPQGALSALQRGDTEDLELQYRFQLSKSQSITTGLGYRHINDAVNARFPEIDQFSLTNRSGSREVLNSFIQDEIELVANRLKATLGTKFEKNTFTDYEIQPGVRIAYTPNDLDTLWTSFSRAVLVPSRTAYDLRDYNMAAFPTRVWSADTSSTSGQR